ncbi:MAG: Ribosomal large subunit pseudouridine synthase F [Parcubacteria group bacterium ADurb.Bin326]|nr:MAG: Ribosomal large subunit pseudouridine synthase F [Parcubacteria group bacterium ADurb.Bin326]
MRLNRYIAQAGICSRRKADNLIARGSIKVNGKTVTSLGVEIDESKDLVECDGKPIKPQERKIYLALNKPLGYISSSSSAQGKSILDLISLRERVYPVGRLDKDSRGLILLTNDGEFAYNLTQAKFNHEKEYEVTLNRQLKPTDKKKLEEDMVLGSEVVKGVKVGRIVGSRVNLTLHEGVNRQIRRMMEKIGYEVEDLRRVRVGKLNLGDLSEGKWKEIKLKDVI